MQVPCQPTRWTSITTNLFSICSQKREEQSVQQMLHATLFPRPQYQAEHEHVYPFSVIPVSSQKPPSFLYPKSASAVVAAINLGRALLLLFNNEFLFSEFSKILWIFLASCKITVISSVINFTISLNYVPHVGREKVFNVSSVVLKIIASIAHFYQIVI